MKTALVTGGSRGIGRGIAEALYHAGYKVLVNSKRRSDLLDGMAGEGYLTHMGDVSDYAYCEELINYAKETLGHIDVMFHNAGTCKTGLVQDLPLEKWQRIMDVNVNSMFYLTRLIVPVMLQQGYGKIIYTTSAWGNPGAAGASAYSASKGAVNAFTQSVAKELAASNIQVNAIAPGCIDTDMNRGYTPEERQALIDDIPAGYFGLPSDVGELALQLAEANRYLTGQIIKIDGGWWS